MDSSQVHTNMMTRSITTFSRFSALMWQVETTAYPLEGVSVWVCLTLVHFASPNRVSMLLLILRWSYGKVLLLPSCSAVQPCPSSSLETSDSSDPRQNTLTHLHPHRDSLHHQNRRQATHPPPPHQHNPQWRPGSWVVLTGEPAQQTRWTLSSQNVR